MEEDWDISDDEFDALQHEGWDFEALLREAEDELGMEPGEMDGLW